MSTVKAINFQHPSATAVNLTLAADGTVSGNAPWGGRNRIMNGGFDIWQRGTSFSYSGPSGDYSADRWAYYTDGTGSAVTVSRQTFTPGAAPVAGYEGTYFLRYNRTAAGTGNTYSNLQQPIEDVRVFAGQTVTISFWAKADAARSVGVSMTQDFGTGGSAAVGLGVIGTASVTTSWQRFSFTASLPSISGKTIGTSSKLYLFLYMGNVVSTVDVWGVQVEAGSAATPFEVKPVGDTLRDCQRYFQRIGAAALGRWASSTGLEIGTPTKVTMRAAPTSVTLSTTTPTIFRVGLGIYYATSASIAATNVAQPNGIQVNMTVGGGGTANAGEFALFDQDYLLISAEL